MRIAVCVSIIYLHLFSVDGLKVALTGCPALSFSGHNLAKLGHDEKHVYLTRSVGLTHYAQVARSVGSIHFVCCGWPSCRPVSSPIRMRFGWLAAGGVLSPVRPRGLRTVARGIETCFRRWHASAAHPPRTNHSAQPCTLALAICGRVTGVPTREEIVPQCPWRRSSAIYYGPAPPLLC